MTLINQDIKNLVSGVSQQPPILRYPEQLEEQVNGFSSEAGGLQKRPPSVHVSRLRESYNSNRILAHFVNRDEKEKYIILFTGTDIEVFDLKGNKKTVNYKQEADKIYIVSEQPRYRIKALTIADYTFITNTEQIAKMKTKGIGNLWDKQGLLINIKSGQYGRNYKIEVNGSVIAQYETPDGSDRNHARQIATDYIVDRLAEGASGQGYQIEKGSSWLYINKTETTTEQGDKVEVGPSTTPKQELDRLKGLGETYSVEREENEWVTYKIPLWGVQNSDGSITLRGVTKSSVNPTPDRGYSYHFVEGGPLMKEIDRCKTDHWIVTSRDIRIKATSGRRSPYYTKEYTLKPDYTSSIPSGSVTKTIIKNYKVYDGFNNQAAFGVMRTTQKFTNLPATGPDGFTVKIAGEDGSSSDDYYVSYNKDENLWRETVRPGLANELDANTLPHVLVRESDGTFTFRTGEWSNREVGDDDSNPEPSFINQTISDVFYHRNRLGFLSGENVILTRSADFFNFWVTSATTVQDTDPIDLAVSDNSISPLYHAVPFDASLILFSDDAQFSLEAPNVLTPKDAYITPPLTHFGTSLKVKPVNAGRNIYFVAERSKYTTVREYFTAADNTESKDAQDITSHVPSYIPNSVYKIIPSSTENLLLFLTEGDQNSIYVYKYLFIDSVRQQAAWSRWDFQDEIYGGAFIDSYFYILIKRNGFLCLEQLSFAYNTTEFADEPYHVLLDSKRLLKVEQDWIDEEDNTVINVKTLLGDLYDETKEYSVVMSDGRYATLSPDNKGIINLEENYANQYFILGINYNFKAVLSPLMVKKETESGIKTLTDGRLQLRQGWVNFADSGYFKIKVNEYVYENTQRILGSTNTTLEKMPFDTGTFKFPLQANNMNCVVSIETNEPLPVSIIGAGWVGNYIRRTMLY